VVVDGTAFRRQARAMLSDGFSFLRGVMAITLANSQPNFAAEDVSAGTYDNPALVSVSVAFDLRQPLSRNITS